MELVDMSSLGLFDFKILSVQVGFTLYVVNGGFTPVFGTFLFSF